jgi:branched-chain amino acid transport system ATP-binding protein
VLSIVDLDVYYGAAKALSGVSFTVNEGEILSLLGSNGAGKSTVMKAISGLVKAKNGSIEFLSEKIVGIKPDAIVRKGISQVPEGRMIFPRMTVLENLEMGAYTVSNVQQIKQSFELVYGLFPKLQERLTQKGGTLSGGEQQMLAIGRALMSKPKCLLLDEPSLGIAPKLVEEIFEKIAELNKQTKLTILLVEQNAVAAMEIAKRGVILENGRVVMDEDTETLMCSDEVKKAYLGL